MKGERVGAVPARQIEQIFSALKQNFVTPTRVAVMGQTGVGKSSLINPSSDADWKPGT